MMKITILAVLALISIVHAGGQYGGGYQPQPQYGNNNYQQPMPYGQSYGQPDQPDQQPGLNLLLLEFYRRNRIPYWSKIQNTPFGPRFFWRRDAVKDVKEEREVTCVYNRTRSVLKCERSPVVLVECNVTENLEKFRFGRFESFSIAAVPIGNGSDVTLWKYSLYPERPDKAGWKHAKIKDLLTQKVFEHSIYFSPNVTDNGYRVNDLTCWNRLVDLWRGVQKPLEIRLGVKPGRVDEVKIVGKILSRN